MSEYERWYLTLFGILILITFYVIWFDRRLDYLEALANRVCC